MNLNQIIRAVQLKLGVTVDGKPGIQTWVAIHNAVNALSLEREIGPNLISSVDARSEAVIKDLQQDVQPYARALVQSAKENNIVIRVISGLRTYAEQDLLYAKGRTAGGARVTNARGGYSNHNFGIAFDIGVFEGNRYLQDSPKYKVVGALGTQLGLEWGGDWKTIVDQPHFQLRPSWANGISGARMLAELRSRKNSGSDFFV